jgi:hypothetical protein
VIPLATTTISVWRVAADETRDGWDAAPARTKVTSGLRAVIGVVGSRGASPSTVQVDIATGDKVVVEFRLMCDPFDFADDDQIVDDTTSETYILLGIVRQNAFGLDHCDGRMRQISGAA